MQFNSYSLNLQNGIYEFSQNGTSEYTNLDILSDSVPQVQIGINLSHQKRKQDLFLDGQNNPFVFSDPQEISNIIYFILKIGIYDEACSKMNVFQRNPVRISTSNPQLEQILTSDVNWQQNHLISTILANENPDNAEPIKSLIFKNPNYYKFSLPYIQKNSDFGVEHMHDIIMKYFQERNEQIDKDNQINGEVYEKTKKYLLGLEQIEESNGKYNFESKLTQFLKENGIIKKKKKKVNTAVLDRIYSQFLKIQNFEQLEIPKSFYSHSIPLKTKITGNSDQVISSFDLVESLPFAQSRIPKLISNHSQGEFLFNPQKLKLIGDSKIMPYINPSLN